MGEDGMHAVYVRSLSGVDLAPPRVSLEGIGIGYLWCRVAPSGQAWIDTCGVINGCPHHGIDTMEIRPSHIDELSAALSPLEAAARIIDVRDLCYCVPAGPCSYRPIIREDSS
ncbi:hypothetical protein [Actinophytocola sp.]|uniref:hypothetical protein n=1 Tax=Actinophytocola sp. TaxID=1872138 RepID=UPI003D6A8A90